MKVFHVYAYPSCTKTPTPPGGASFSPSPSVLRLGSKCVVSIEVKSREQEVTLPPLNSYLLVQPTGESSQWRSPRRAPQRRRDDVVPGDGDAAGANAGAPGADNEPRRRKKRALHGHVGDGQAGLLFLCVCVF